MKDILTAIFASAILISPAFAYGYYGAPGPIAGAGLPILAVGFGVYWLVRRSRRKPD